MRNNIIRTALGDNSKVITMELSSITRYDWWFVDEGKVLGKGMLCGNMERHGQQVSLKEDEVCSGMGLKTGREDAGEVAKQW